MRHTAVAWCVCVTALLSGCGADPPRRDPNAAGLEPPPRLVPSGPDGRGRTWANTDAFKPIPRQLRAKGEEICGTLGLVATGFHPRAQDETGRPLAEGGFLCQPAGSLSTP